VLRDKYNAKRDRKISLNITLFFMLRLNALNHNLYEWVLTRLT
jgi:hypothetical protein